ncbi:hypothetical protein DMUE_4449 [Dictyocoela muelleri]|nr:hypothetical protein DMUE_4449 [Dictyocoela muelleri]
MKFYDGKREYFYCRIACKMTVPHRHNTILQSLKIKYKKIVFFCYFYFYKETITKNLLRNLGISRNTIVELKKIIIVGKIIYFHKYESKLGCENVTVEDDGSLIASSKYAYGYFIEQVWVFGVI